MQLVKGTPDTRTRRRVLVTGIAGILAGRLARRLERDERVEYVLGVDVESPRHRLERTEFVQTDLRKPLAPELVESARIDTLVHLALTAVPAHTGGRARMKERNVIGTMQLLAAAQKAPRLRTVVLKSTTAVYGSHYADPALFREDATPGTTPRSGYSRDAMEVESYGRVFARRRPDATLTTLRFANFVGGAVDSAMARYFQLPVVPTVLGYDPRIQLCHEDDALEILYRSCVESHPGTYNVAGPGIMYLSQAVRIAGKPTAPIPAPLVGGFAALLRRRGLIDFSADQLRFLYFGRVGDISRMRAHFDYEPRFSTREAFADFLVSRSITPLVDRETARRVERRLRGLLTSPASGDRR